MYVHLGGCVGWSDFIMLHL